MAQILVKNKQLYYLVVQKDPVDILLKTQFLQLKKIKFDVAKNMNDAYNKLSSGLEFDGIMMDCDITYESIQKTMQNIKVITRKNFKKEMTIIGIVSNGDEHFIKEAVSIGVKKVFAKPVDFKTMATLL